VGYLLGLTAICPFVSALSDLFGRRCQAIGGMVVLIVGQIIASTAHNMKTFIGTDCWFLVTLWETLLVPSWNDHRRCRRRHQRTHDPSRHGGARLDTTTRNAIAILIDTILLFVPSVMWAQLIASYATWRYVGLLTSFWAFIGLLILPFFYFPPPRPNSAGLSKMQIIGQIDYLGGLLSISVRVGIKNPEIIKDV
jgi:MFS family permease